MCLEHFSNMMVLAAASHNEHQKLQPSNKINHTNTRHNQLLILFLGKVEAALHNKHWKIGRCGVCVYAAPHLHKNYCSLLITLCGKHVAASSHAQR